MKKSANRVIIDNLNDSNDLRNVMSKVKFHEYFKLINRLSLIILAENGMSHAEYLDYSAVLLYQNKFTEDYK